jgi:hypothetical protein
MSTPTQSGTPNSSTLMATPYAPTAMKATWPKFSSPV